MRNYLELAGKVALITGASSGIGAATAEVLADLGAKVALGFGKNKTGAAQVCRNIVEAGGTAMAVRADARRSVDIRVMVEKAAAALGPIDILINNAGSLIERRPLADMPEALWDEVMNLNLKSALLCAQAVAPSMVARRTGAIVNVVSIAGRNGGGPGAGAYAAAKGGLITLTKALAKELAPSGIRVNAVSPGVIDTPFHKRFSTPDMMSAFISAIPLGRVGLPRECATAIAFLASEAASFIVGETIEVNGGQLML